MQQSENAKARILIVDDQKPNLHILRDLLYDQGEIVLAKNATQGLEKAQKLRPDLILLDVMMPDMDGFETLQELKKLEGLEDIPVMFITGLRDIDNEQKGLMLGALDYIRKPFNPAIVKARVSTHLKLARQNKTLKQLSEQLIAADAAKSQFLATMSHEIRTPLTSIIGYAEALRAGDIEKSETGKAVTSICNNGEHLLELVNDILDMSKIEANQLQIEMIDICLPRWIKNVQDIITQRAKAKKLDFRVQFNFPLPTQVVSDPTRMQQILLNLLNNAVKFTSKGSVILDVSCNDDSLIFKVIDSGIGIERDQLEAIFDAFSQAEMSTNRKYGGSGLGLNISKHLAQKLGGDIEVQSEKGKGSEFKAIVKVYEGKDSKRVVDEEEWSEILHLEATKQSWPKLSGKVLLAEDQPDIQQLIKMMLEISGLQVVTVNDGNALVEKSVQENFDLILTDIQMPGLNGVDAMQKLKELGVLAPVIALTANAMAHQREGYQDAGFTDYICKPFSREQFIQTIAYHLQRNQREIAEFEKHIEQEAKAIAKTFLVTLPDQISTAAHYLEEHDWKEFGEVAHAIKGAALTFGFDKMGEIAADIESSVLISHEQLADDIDSVELAHKLAELKAAVDSTMANYDVTSTQSSASH